jgi:hypothetical protein
MGADPVADGEDGFEVIVLDEARNLPLPLGLNYSEFPNSCGGVKLRFSIRTIRNFRIVGPGSLLEEVLELNRQVWLDDRRHRSSPSAPSASSVDSAGTAQGQRAKGVSVLSPCTRARITPWR